MVDRPVAALGMQNKPCLNKPEQTYNRAMSVAAKNYPFEANFCPA